MNRELFEVGIDEGIDQHMMKLLIAASALLLSGCITSGAIGARDYAVSNAADAYDESLHNAELWVCRGSSVGSVVRRYASSDELWESYLKLCGYKGDAPTRPLSPE